MPRQKCVDEAGGVYHALNCGNARQAILHKDEDLEAFLRVLGDGLQKCMVELFSFCLMPSHWHRYHAHYQTSGQGHLYQSRFKSFPILDDAHFLVGASSEMRCERVW